MGKKPEGWISPVSYTHLVDFRPMAEKRTFIVGRPDAAVKESGQRVDTAIQNSGLPFQQGLYLIHI